VEAGVYHDGLCGKRKNFMERSFLSPGDRRRIKRCFRWLRSNRDLHVMEALFSAANMTEPTIQKEETRITIPRRMIIIPSTGFIVGSAIGMMRGGRAASLRFLAENAHRAPRTVEGWYFYKKTKNYRVMWGALKGGGIGGMKVGLVSLGYVGLESGIGRHAPGWKEIGAGIGTATLFSVVCKDLRSLAELGLK